VLLLGKPTGAGSAAVSAPAGAGMVAPFAPAGSGGASAEAMAALGDLLDGRAPLRALGLRYPD